MAFSSGRACAAIVVVAGLLVPTTASASNEGQSIDFEGFGTAWRAAPLTLTDPSRPDLVGLKLPSDGGAMLAGMGAEWDYRSRTVVFHMASLRWRHGITASDGTAVANETTYDVHPVSLDVVEVGLPLPLLAGVSFQSISDGWKIEVGASWGWAWLWGSARVADPLANAQQQLSASASSPFFRGDLRACTRVGGEHWGCLTLTPDIYEFGWLPGASAGLMVDL